MAFKYQVSAFLRGRLTSRARDRREVGWVANELKMTVNDGAGAVLE